MLVFRKRVGAAITSAQLTRRRMKRDAVRRGSGGPQPKHRLAGGANPKGTQHDFIEVRDHLDPALRNISEFEYVTGWRIDTEVLRLVWGQVDLAAGEARIDDPRSTKETRRPECFPLTRDLRRTLEA